MKKSRGGVYFILISLIATTVFAVSSCDLKSRLETHEEEQIREFLRLNNITVDPLESGLYYIELMEGDGEYPVEGDTLGIFYTARFLTGVLFDGYTHQQHDEPLKIIFGSSQFVDGFTEGLSLMKEGGEAELLLPSKLAFGPYGHGMIPGYTPIFYTVVLEEVIPGPNRDNGDNGDNGYNGDNGDD